MSSEPNAHRRRFARGCQNDRDRAHPSEGCAGRAVVLDGKQVKRYHTRNTNRGTEGDTRDPGSVITLWSSPPASALQSRQPFRRPFFGALFTCRAPPYGSKVRSRRPNYRIATRGRRATNGPMLKPAQADGCSGCQRRYWFSPTHGARSCERGL